MTSVWLSGFTALAQVVGIGFSIYFVERWGRRQLVLTSLALVTVCLIGLGTTFYLARTYSTRVTHQAIANSTCNSQQALVWSGKTSYCYDCAQISNCGFCNGVCVPGTNHKETCVLPSLARYDLTLCVFLKRKRDWSFFTRRLHCNIGQ